MQYLIKVAICLLMLFFATQTQAQITSQKWSAIVRFYHQDDGINIDVGSLQTTDAVSIRPGAEIGVERNWRTRNRFRFTQTLHAGYWNNTYSENYTYAGSRLTSDWRTFGQLRLGTQLGLDYGRAKTSDLRYAYENGKWEPVRNSTPGFGRTQISLSLSAGYKFAAQSAHPIEVQANFGFQFATPYLPKGPAGNIPFLYRNMGIAVKYAL
jgi:hypothetical protein